MSAVAGSLGSKDSAAAPRRIGGRQDKFSFFVIFLVGSAGIVLLGAYFHLWEGYVIIWSVAWMLIYLALVTLTDRYRLRPDQAGDNLYYLGFLYTLVSLSVALYLFTRSEAAVEHIISNFGIALATTILGISLRVVLHQMREDPVDTEREARQNLADAANRLRAELDTSVNDMSSFGRLVRQSIEEALHDVSKQSGKLLEDSGGQITRATKTASEGIQEALSTFSDHAKALNAVSRRQVEATEKLVERIEAIDVPMNVIERTLAPALEQIVTRANAKVAEIETKVAEGQVAILRMQSVTVEELKAKVSRQIEEFESQLRELRETGANGIVGSMRALADRQNEAFSEITRQAEATLASLQQSRQAMEQEADRARVATAEVMQQLKSMVQALAHELGSSRLPPHRRE